MLDNNYEKAFAVWMVVGYVIFNVQLPVAVAVTQGDSMQPTIEPCSIAVLDANPQSVEVGDVVARYSEDGTDRLLLHRVVQDTGGGLVTQGDAESQVDMGLAEPGEVIGELVWHSPGLC